MSAFLNTYTARGEIVFMFKVSTKRPSCYLEEPYNIHVPDDAMTIGQSTPNSN